MRPHNDQPSRRGFLTRAIQSAVTMAASAHFGSALAPLVAGAADAVSPHAQRISYYCNGEIHVNELGKPEGKPVTTGHWDFKPSWSKTGDMLVCFRRLKDDPDTLKWKTAIFVVNVDGTGRRPLVDGGPGTEDRFPVWAADGRIYFLRGYDSYRNAIVAVDPDGGDQEVVTAVGAAVGFSVSPVGMWLVFCDAGDLVCVAASGLGAQIVVVSKAEVDNGRLSAGVYGPSSWSSDGRMIAFGFGSGPWAWPGPIHVVRSDGWSVREVPRVIGWDPAVRPE